MCYFPRNQELQSNSPESPCAPDLPAQISTPHSPTQSDHWVSESRAVSSDESDLDDVSGQLVSGINVYCLSDTLYLIFI